MSTESSLNHDYFWTNKNETETPMKHTGVLSVFLEFGTLLAKLDSIMLLKYVTRWPSALLLRP